MFRSPDGTPRPQHTSVLAQIDYTGFSLSEAGTSRGGSALCGVDSGDNDDLFPLIFPGADAEVKRLIGGEDDASRDQASRSDEPATNDHTATASRPDKGKGKANVITPTSEDEAEQYFPIFKNANQRRDKGKQRAVEDSDEEMFEVRDKVVKTIDYAENSDEEADQLRLAIAASRNVPQVMPNDDSDQVCDGLLIGCCFILMLIPSGRALRCRCHGCR